VIKLNLQNDVLLMKNLHNFFHEGRPTMGKSNLVQVLHKWESAWAYYERIIFVTPDFMAKTRCSLFVCLGTIYHTYSQNYSISE
jgi:hypothetical protein